MKCEQNCEADAEVLVYDQAPQMFMFLCEVHENELARMEGDDELDEVDLRYSTTQQIGQFLNDIIAKKDNRYTELLNDFLAMKKKLEQD